MASKRKRSKPTRITEDEVVSGEGDGNAESSSYIDDTLSKIQQYIEQGSEDTPDCLERKLDEQPQASDDSYSLPPKLLRFDSTSIHDLENSEERTFPQVFVNGQIPSNLKFHQLMKDEEESLNKCTEVLPFPDTKAIHSVPDGNAQPIFSVPDTKPTFSMSDKKPTPIGSDEYISFKQVSTHKKLIAKRSKPCDDETPRYSCTMCKYVTNRSDHYKRHLMTHSSDKPLKCAMCVYETGRSDHYKRHLQRHGLSEQEIIATCFRNGLKLKNTVPVGQVSENGSSGTVPKGNQNQKIVAHVEEPKSFARTEKRYKCDQCNYATDKSSHLKRHQNSHSKSNLSRCGKCNKTFRKPYYLNSHRCGEDSGHKCPKCPLSFSEHKTLLCHILDKHRDDGALVSMAAPFLQNSHKEKLAAGENEIKTPISSVSIKKDAETTNEIAIFPLTSNPDDVEKTTPMDLTLPSRQQTRHVMGTARLIEKKTDVTLATNGDKKSESILPNVPSNLGNMGCTKCGGWFNKLNEYSTHACVS